MIDGEGTHKTSLNIRRDLLAVLDAEVARTGGNRATLIIRYLTEGLERDAQRDLVASGIIPPSSSPAVPVDPPRMVEVRAEPILPAPVEERPAQPVPTVVQAVAVPAAGRRLEPHASRPGRYRTASGIIDPLLWSAIGAFGVVALPCILPGTSAPAFFVARAVVDEPRNPYAAGVKILKQAQADFSDYNRLAGMALVGRNQYRINECYRKADQRFAGTSNWRRLQTCTVYVPTSRHADDVLLGVPDGE